MGVVNRLDQKPSGPYFRSTKTRDPALSKKINRSFSAVLIIPSSYLSRLIIEKSGSIVGLSPTGQNYFCMGGEPNIVRFVWFTGYIFQGCISFLNAVSDYLSICTFPGKFLTCSPTTSEPQTALRPSRSPSSMKVRVHLNISCSRLHHMNNMQQNN